MKEKILSFDTKEQNIFFTSDTHFWHDNIIKFCNLHFFFFKFSAKVAQIVIRTKQNAFKKSKNYHIYLVLCITCTTFAYN